ncbi:uncharacterized protein [Aegilops tauschii subsp. strangulata]|uniref:uncharacterized protein n=1 Tax=Aegilops tauschii subsp. strangulata TaxID=200361 RepID=UPI003CC84430
MHAFHEAISDCALQDLGWRGVPFTCDNRQQGNMNVKARLDRAFANADFLQMFEFSIVKHISSVESDHCFLLAECRATAAMGWSRATQSFRYENVWQSHADYDEKVRKMWQSGAGQGGLQGIVDALSMVQSELGAWGHKEFWNMERRVRKLQKRLERLRTAAIGCGPNDEERVVASQLREALRQEEIWLKQRSRVLWLHAGDRNTSYFQAQARQRKRINRITSLELADGHVSSDPGEVKEEITHFYHALYQSQGYNPMEGLLQCVQPRVTDDMNYTLEREYTAADVKIALFDMAPSKAPGVDGFTAGFYQRHWDGGRYHFGYLEFFERRRITFGTE